MVGDGISFKGDPPPYASLRSVIVKDSDLEKYKAKTLIEKYSTPTSLDEMYNPYIDNTLPKNENFISPDLQNMYLTRTPPIIQDMYKRTFKEPVGDTARLLSRNPHNEYLFPNEITKHSKTITGYNDKTSKLERIIGAYSSDKLSNELIKIAQRTKPLKPEMEDLDDSVEGIISRYKQNTRKPLKPEIEALGFENPYYANTNMLPNPALEARKKLIIKELKKVRNLKPNNYYNFNLRPLFALPIIATTTTKIKSSDKKKIKPTKFGGYERLTKK